MTKKMDATAMELHPLCSLFPRIEGSEFDALVADIKANGLREPIIVHEGFVLDGGNRYRACIAAGVEPTTMKFGGGNLVDYVLSANLHRRHLSEGQRSAIVASAQDWAKAKTHGGDRKSDQAATLPLDSVAGRAAVSGVSDRTQRDADKVAKADPELAKRVGLGKISLPKAVKQIAPKPKPAAPKAEPETPPDDEAAMRAEMQADAMEALREENESLRNQVAAMLFDGSDEDKAEYLKLMDDHIKEIKSLANRLADMTASRNSWQNEVADLKAQVKRQRRELDKKHEAT